MMEYIKLGEVCNILNGFAFKSEKYIDSGIRVIRITNVQKGYIEDSDPQYYPSSEYENIKKYMLFESDILMSLTGNVGRVATLQKELLPAALNQRVACLRLFDESKIHKPFLFHYLNSEFFEQQCILSSKGVAQKNMSTEWLKDYKIPLLSIEKQKQIASIFDIIDGLICDRKSQSAILDQLVKSRFIEMFGDPISNPLGWKVKRLAEISLLITNGNTPKGGSENYTEKGIMFLRSQNVWRNHIDLDDVVYIDEATHLAMKKSSVHDRDVLITKTGRINTENSSLGRAALFRGEDNSANINGHVYLIRLDGSIMPEYVVAILTGEPYRRYIRKVCVGGIDKRQINLDQVEDFPIIMPPMELQQQFAAFVEQTDKSKFYICQTQEIIELLIRAIQNITKEVLL